MNTLIKSSLGLVCLMLLSLTSFAQKDSLNRLNEVVISGILDESELNASVNITKLELQSSEQSLVFNLTDALKATPGVTALSTGPAVSKPSIRGLYGNRILVLVSSMRFDNQQWQDEHGLGLSDIGLDRVEVIKGPMSILYGTDAVGGVINLIPESKAPVNQRVIDGGIRYQSNTGGVLAQIGVKQHFGKWWLGARVATENHADYQDGNNIRVLNSRFNGTYATLNLGYATKQWVNDIHYYFSYNQFGFIFSDLQQFLEPDNRWSRNINGPHHIVTLNMLSSENTIQLKKSTLKINLGYQSNFRQEDEGGGKLSLQMQLNSLIGSVKWIKDLNEKTKLILANNTSIEQNINYGARKLVPDAFMAENAFSVYMRHHWNKVILEYGIGAGIREIKTHLTPSVNGNEKLIDPFDQTRSFANLMAGLNHRITKHLTWKLNTATGVRAPNLSELSSNGLHEGIYTFEVGDPSLKNEQNWNTDLSILWKRDQIDLSASAFYNVFQNYIYLEPTEEKWFGFPIYRFKQGLASLYGGEVSGTYSPKYLKLFRFEMKYSGLIGKLLKEGYLPYMPPPQWTPKVAYQFSSSKHGELSAFVEMIFTEAQNRVWKEETQTNGYQLINAGLSYQLKHKNTFYDASIGVRNLLNESYFNHLSRLKPYGILDMGRNISFQLKIKLNQQQSKI